MTSKVCQGRLSLECLFKWLNDVTTMVHTSTTSNRFLHDTKRNFLFFIILTEYILCWKRNIQSNHVNKKLISLLSLIILCLQSRQLPNFKLLALLNTVYAESYFYFLAIVYKTMLRMIWLYIHFELSGMIDADQEVYIGVRCRTDLTFQTMDSMWFLESIALFDWFEISKPSLGSIYSAAWLFCFAYCMLRGTEQNNIYQKILIWIHNYSSLKTSEVHPSNLISKC